MIFTKETYTKSNIYLFLFVIFCILALFTIKLDNFFVNLLVRSLRYLFILLYYLSLVKKPNTFILLFILFFFVAGGFLTHSPSNIYGLLLICASRVVLIKIAISDVNINNVNWKSFVFVSLLFVVIGFLILSLYYNNSPVFYITVFSIVSLVALLSISYLNLLNTTKKWNLRFFSAISLFVLSDTIFGIQRLTKIDPTFLLIASVFYLLAYFLIIQSDIEKQRFINKGSQRNRKTA